MIKQSLNGLWEYRIGKGKFAPKNVPFSCLAVGHSECKRSFDLEHNDEKIFLKFDGITYAAIVYLNGKKVGEMLPYSEYSFDITEIVKDKENELLVEIEDIAPRFGPSEGWENFGGIIRDVSLLYSKENYIKDVFFHYELVNDYTAAKITTDTLSSIGEGVFEIKLFSADALVCSYSQDAKEASKEYYLENIELWTPETPDLYRLEVSLNQNGEMVDVYSCFVGFREFTCGKHRFYLNGKPIFLKGVCKHEMFGDSGHCPTEEQMRQDMQMIKEAGCNFVRLVHYPHNKRVVEIADELGLMVSEEPGLWWSDTSDPQISAGSLEVLRRTVLRDRNHPSIMFWLCFNECRFTEQFLIDSAKVCRENDPTRLVSGANCMGLEDTLKYYNICGFDFYTLHPYAETMERAKEAAKVLNDKPLLFSEWGGYYVYDNPHLLKNFMTDMYNLYLADSDEGALAGASFWEWSELNDFNRGEPACIDGNLSEGLVDKYRNPTLIFETFCDTLKNMGKSTEKVFWIEYENGAVAENNLINEGDKEVYDNTLANFLEQTREVEAQKRKMRRRRLRKGPLMSGVENLNETPLVLQDNESICIDCNISADKLSVFGLVSLTKGYPLSGDYGEKVAEITVTYEDASQEKTLLCNGTDITTVFELLGSSMINPVTENCERFATFGYDKNFERYIINKRDIAVSNDKVIKNITISSENNGYTLLIYGITK